MSTVTFQMHHGVTLNCTKKTLMPLTTYATDKESEIAELRALAEKFKTCTEFVPKEAPKAKGKGKKADSESASTGGAETVTADDLANVNGIGKATEAKLKEKGITKKSELVAALADEKRVDEMKELLAPNYEKIVTQLKAA